MAVAQYPAMSEWIDINETVKLSGKSIATIRRAIKRLSSDSIKKDRDKHLYKREVILNELGVDTTVAISPDTVMPQSTIEHDTSIETPLIEALKDQIRMQSEQLHVKDEQIAQLLERQREFNILMNTQRQITVQAPEKPADEKKREQWISHRLYCGASAYSRAGCVV